MATKIQINLSDGRSMKAELYEDVAPITVANFLKLVDDNFYNGLIFHRVIPGFMIQGGGMNETMEPKEAKSIKGEFIQNGVKNTLKHTLGVLSMARTSMPNSASSQFFICVDDTPHLDGAYAAFGKLLDKDSEKVAIDISNVKTTSFGWFQDVPSKPIVIKNIVRI
jgi:peptidyl-prolyl cis-trans isomerase B (cyclophilin B)